jgi:hypothetical protein
MKTKVLYKPDNELLALSIKSLLEKEEIYAIIRSYQIPAYDGIAQMMRPHWGEIIVAEEDYERAKELLDGFLSSAKEAQGLEQIEANQTEPSTEDKTNPPKTDKEQLENDEPRPSGRGRGESNV